MPRARPMQNSFNAGELSPLLDGRVDQDKYFSGCKTLSNFITTVQGPARKRGGTRHVALVKDSARRTWLADFVFSAGQAYVLEFGHNYIRFFTGRAPLMSGAVPYEVATPYTEADLITVEGTFALRTLQSKDVMWIVHAEGKHPPYRLSRLGALSWTLAVEETKDGPFRDVNVDAAATVQASAVTGSVTVTSSTAIFTAAHVGSLFQLQSMNPGTVPPFQASTSYTVGAFVRNGGSVYEAITAGGGGTLQRYVPTHTEGDANDGIVTWRYLHSGSGHGEITAVAGDGLSCTMTVISRLPAEVVSANTRRWAFSEFSPVYGWPTGVTFFRERLTYIRGATVFMSVVGDFPNFAAKDAGIVTKETAVKLLITADKVDDVRWIAQSKSLLVGSARTELSLQEQTPQTVFAADNAIVVPQTEYGSRPLRPLRVGEGVLFVERAGHRVRDMRFSFEIDRYKAEDLTVLSEHLFDGSEIIGDAEQEQREIIDWAYQQQRDSLVWCVMSDGTLSVMALNRERGVIAWTPHYIGGPEAKAEAVQSIPSPDGRTDDAWLIVDRTIGGAPQRSIEYVTDYRLVKQGAAEAFHVDCGGTYRGAPTSSVAVGTRFNGQTLRVCVDGANHPPCAVAGGVIALQRPGSVVHYGYGFAARMQTMRLEVQGGAGTAQSAQKGIARVYLRMQSTIGGYCGPSFDRMDPVKTLNTVAPVGQPPKLFSGDYELTFPDGFNTDGYVCYENADPLPATLVAIVSRVQIND